MGNPIYYPPEDEKEETTPREYCRYGRSNRRVARNPFRRVDGPAGTVRGDWEAAYDRYPGSPSRRAPGQITWTTHRGLNTESRPEAWSSQDDVDDGGLPALVDIDDSDDEERDPLMPTLQRAWLDLETTWAPLEPRRGRLTAEAESWAERYRAATGRSVLRQWAERLSQQASEQAAAQLPGSQQMQLTDTARRMQLLDAYSRSDAWAMLRREMRGAVAGQQSQPAPASLPSSVARARRVAREVLDQLDGRLEDLENQQRSRRRLQLEPAPLV